MIQKYLPLFFKIAALAMMVYVFSLQKEGYMEELGISTSASPKNP